ncbi:MAG TPA: class I SAM-dependent methyltransferase [Polyangiaceae bacterium]|nr:class I SAM-dependent methyltransferase [Polyangiaceae bacterium]
MSVPALRDVSDTARWVAYFRAVESERPDALFADPYARVLAGERGQRIAEQLPKGPLSWSIAVRTKVFDELVLEAITSHGARTVVNLAAGLDTRPYRLPLPPDLRWVEVDLPELVASKTDALRRERPRCRVERMALDLADADARRALFSQFDHEPGCVLVVTEGLLVYLEEEVVTALARELREYFPTGLWLMENISPAVLARMKRLWESTLYKAAATMKFAPPEGLRFYEPLGWAPVAERALIEEAGRFRREMRVVTVIRALGRILPPVGAAFARRQERFRDAVVYALMAPKPPQ